MVRGDASSLRPPHAKVSVTLPDGGSASGGFTGGGPIDTVVQAINVASGVPRKLSELTIGAVTEGQDTLGAVVVEASQTSSTLPRAYVRALSVAMARVRAGEAIGLPQATPG